MLGLLLLGLLLLGLLLLRRLLLGLLLLRRALRRLLRRQLLRRLLAGSKPQPGRSTANYHPILHPGHSLQAGQRTHYTSWWCRKHTRAGLVARGARMGHLPTRIRPARLWRREWPSVASRPPRGRVPWRRLWSGTRDGAN